MADICINLTEKLSFKGKFLTYILAWNEIEQMSLQRVHIQKYMDR